MRTSITDNSGFTLVELAITLVVIGLLIGLGMGMVGPLISISKTRDSRETVSAALDSITSWAAGNNSIPATAAFPSVVKSPQDAWGRDLIYLYDTNLAPAIATKDTICGRGMAAITLVTTSPAATIPNVAYLVLSRGDDSVVQTTLNGTLNGAAFNAVVNGSGTATGTVTLDANNSDILRWVTIDELRSKTGCQGGQMRIVNNELPPGTVSAPYPSATAGAVLGLALDGGATPGIFRWCIEAASATPLPAGLVFTPALPVSATRISPNTCNGTNPLVESSWGLAATLSISGTPAAATQGAYNFTVYARDNNDTARDALALPNDNDNFAQKNFVLTINP